MATLYKNDGHAATVARQRARRAVVAGRARWLDSKPAVTEVRQPTRPPVRHARTPFGQGVLASRPNYRLDCTLADMAFWEEESRREEDRLIDRMYAEFRAQERIDAGLDA